jgi:hypothetical protein
VCHSESVGLGRTKNPPFDSAISAKNNALMPLSQGGIPLCETDPKVVLIQFCSTKWRE